MSSNSQALRNLLLMISDVNLLFCAVFEPVVFFLFDPNFEMQSVRYFEPPPSKQINIRDIHQRQGGYNREKT